MDLILGVKNLNTRDSVLTRLLSGCFESGKLVLLMLHIRAERESLGMIKHTLNFGSF